MSVRALNLYYARDADASAQVLATRLRATDVRERIGIPRGRVFARVDGDKDLPDVMWHCPFADAAAHGEDMRLRAASIEFERCRAVMRTLTRRFERVLYDEIVICDEPETSPGDGIGQLWLTRGQAARPDFGPLHSTAAATVLTRADANDRLPDWIVESHAAGADLQPNAITRWLARQRIRDAMVLRWRRVA